MTRLSTLPEAIFDQLAGKGRRVLSSWRALIFARRATFSIAPRDRRWTQLPNSVQDLYPLLRRMEHQGEIRALPKHRHCYEVTLPYARHALVDEREVLLELNPYSMLSHFTALVFHGLTDEQPKTLTATVSADGTGGLLPIGTASRDWEDLTRPTGQKPFDVMGRNVQWRTVKPSRIYGFEEFESIGAPLRITIVERTLIDALQAPDLCGGAEHVLLAWVRARETLDIDILISQVDRYDSKILKQRVGYILSQFGISHRALAQWQEETHRGGSSRLIASAAFSSNYDAAWNISLNGPIHILSE